jgi:hypothetical protein
MEDIEPLITTVAEHQIDLNLLPERATILDLGCLGMLFTREMRRRGHNVYAVDIQAIDEDYHRVAITNYNGYGYIVYTKDRQAVRFSMDDGIHFSPGETERIKCKTLATFMRDIKVDFFDYIKCDVESSEYQIIMSLNKAPSRQFECEFHLHTGLYGDNEVSNMVGKLMSLGYKIASHEKTAQHGCGLNYWSSLFILPYETN